MERWRNGEREWRLTDVATVSGGRGARGATHIVVDWEVIVDVTGDALGADLGVGGVVILHLCICRRKRNSIVCLFFSRVTPRSHSIYHRLLAF